MQLHNQLQNIHKFLINPAFILLKAIFVILCLYAITFTLTVSYGAWKAWEYTENLLNEVKILATENPQRSRYMQSLLDSNRTDSLVLEHDFVPIDSISKPLQQSVLAAEDAAFYLHPGIDVRAIAAAMETNQSRGKTVFGGSTITQQLSKNLFLSPERSWERKAKEVVYALLMEHYLGKKRIFELYLNYAQWGKNIFGIGAAARIYYNTTADKLNWEQSMRLASVLAKPARYTPHYTKSIFLAKRRKVILENLYLSRKVSDEFYAENAVDTLLDDSSSIAADSSTEDTLQVNKEVDSEVNNLEQSSTGDSLIKTLPRKIPSKDSGRTKPVAKDSGVQIPVVSDSRPETSAAPE